MEDDARRWRIMLVTSKRFHGIELGMTLGNERREGKENLLLNVGGSGCVASLEINMNLSVSVCFCQFLSVWFESYFNELYFSWFSSTQWRIDIDGRRRRVYNRRARPGWRLDAGEEEQRRRGFRTDFLHRMPHHEWILNFINSIF